MIGIGNNDSIDSERSLVEGLEREIGPVSGEYSCHYKHIQGKLYAGSKGAWFRGHIFFFEHQRCFRWADILSVQTTDQGKLCFVDSAQDRHEFSGIRRVEKVWASLYSLQKDCLQEQSHPDSTSTTTHRQTHMKRAALMRGSLRRMNSDPTSSTPTTTEVTTAAPEAVYMAAATLSNVGDMRSDMKRNSSSRTMHTDGFVADLEEAWEQLHQEQAADSGFSEVAIQDKELPCSLSQFVALFVEDNAPNSMERFMEEEGDENLVTSPWVQQSSSSNSSNNNNTKADMMGTNSAHKAAPVQHRTIEYSHPVNAPLAPPMARARKEQRLSRYGQHGIAIETDTFVDDVPMTDCFYVTDRLLVSAKSKRTVTVTARFEIRFTKSTMFRAIIANTTRSEFLKMNRVNFNKMLRALGKGQGDTVGGGGTVGKQATNQDGTSDSQRASSSASFRGRQKSSSWGVFSFLSSPMSMFSFSGSSTLSSWRSLALYGMAGAVLTVQVLSFWEMREMRQSLLASELRQEALLRYLQKDVAALCGSLAAQVAAGSGVGGLGSMNMNGTIS